MTTGSYLLGHQGSWVFHEQLCSYSLVNRVNYDTQIKHSVCKGLSRMLHVLGHSRFHLIGTPWELPFVRSCKYQNALVKQYNNFRFICAIKLMLFSCYMHNPYFGKYSPLLPCSVLLSVLDDRLCWVIQFVLIVWCLARLHFQPLHLLSLFITMSKSDISPAVSTSLSQSI